jgi:hypothetical protein
MTLPFHSVFPQPPATSTVPSFSNVAVWLPRGNLIEPVADHCPVAGS